MITAGSKMAKSNVMGLVMTSYTTYPATLTGSLSFWYILTSYHGYAKEFVLFYCQ